MIIQNECIIISLSFKEIIPHNVHQRYTRIQNSKQFSNLLINKFMHFVERMADELDNTYHSLKMEDQDQPDQLDTELGERVSEAKQQAGQQVERQGREEKCATISIQSLESESESVETGAKTNIKKKNEQKRFKYIFYQEARARLMRLHPFSNHPTSALWRTFRRTAGRTDGLRIESLKEVLSDRTIDERLKMEIRQCVKDTLQDEYFWLEFLKKKGCGSIRKSYLKKWIALIRQSIE